MAEISKLVYKGNRANLPTSRSADAFYLCVNTRELFFGNDLYTEAVRFYTGATQKPATTAAAQGVLYIDTETGNGDVWNGTAYVPVIVSTIGESGNDTAVPTVAAVREHMSSAMGDLGALAKKDKVAETDLEDALATKLNGKADVGESGDFASKNTIYGAKKYADEAVATAREGLIGDDETVEAETIKDAVTEAKDYTDEQITSRLSSTYKAGGTKTFADIGTPAAAIEGVVYNISDEFTTTADFVEGIGKKHPAGTNIVCVNTSGTEYKWDVLAGFVDLSSYATKTEVAGDISAAKTELIGSEEGVTATTIQGAVKEAKTADKSLEDRITALEAALTVGTF